ncbi:MAG TPA: FHA domain-containing protein [Vicinamibacterales bacterium]
MNYILRIKDGRSEHERLLVGVLSVGRDPRCDISDADPLLSRRHAEFTDSLQGVEVRDLGSRNGLLVNGKRQTDALLRPGDVVQIAHLAITVLSAASAGPAPAEVAPSDPRAEQTVGERRAPSSWSVQVQHDDRTNFVPSPALKALSMTPLPAPGPAIAGDGEEDIPTLVPGRVTAIAAPAIVEQEIPTVGDAPPGAVAVDESSVATPDASGTSTQDSGAPAPSEPAVDAPIAAPVPRDVRIVRSVDLLVLTSLLSFGLGVAAVMAWQALPGTLAGTAVAWAASAGALVTALGCALLAVRGIRRRMRRIGG